MSESQTPPPPVYIACPNEACRRRVTEFFHHEEFSGRFVVLDESQAAPRDEPSCVELMLCETERAELGAIDARQAFVFPLATNCSDETLRAAAMLLVEVARLRKSLTDARQSEDALQHLAATDPLTGLANRRTWDDELARQAGRAAATGEPLTVALVDLDEFKRVNDRQGHSVGDGVLRAAAEGLRRAVRRGDLAARIGGDEFGLLLPGLGAAAAATVVDRIRRAAADAVARADLPETTCSVGAAAGQGGEVAAETLYAAAAAALQVAKQAGRDRTVCR